MIQLVERQLLTQKQSQSYRRLQTRNNSSIHIISLLILVLCIRVYYLTILNRQYTIKRIWLISLVTIKASTTILAAIVLIQDERLLFRHKRSQDLLKSIYKYLLIISCKRLILIKPVGLMTLKYIYKVLNSSIRYQFRNSFVQFKLKTLLSIDNSANLTNSFSKTVRNS